jgi:hypothetical protein
MLPACGDPKGNFVWNVHGIISTLLIFIRFSQIEYLSLYLIVSFSRMSKASANVLRRHMHGTEAAPQAHFNIALSFFKSGF